jgi:sulfinoalanine decarboxylase
MIDVMLSPGCDFSRGLLVGGAIGFFLSSVYTRSSSNHDADNAATEAGMQATHQTQLLSQGKLSDTKLSIGKELNDKTDRESCLSVSRTASISDSSLSYRVASKEDGCGDDCDTATDPSSDSDNDCDIDSSSVVATSIKNRTTTNTTESGTLIQIDAGEGDEDGAWHVLQETLRLFANQCSNYTSDEVVLYKHPEELLEQFQLDTGGHAIDIDVSSRTNSSHDDTEDGNREPVISPKAMVKILATIQKYSVKTSHKYFFNQMFGTMDPIAYAGELVALSLNTSPYTYEAAPVFTMMERTLVRAVAHLVYRHDDDDEESKTVEYDGMMMPGGSLSNLAAIHAARHWYAANWLEAQKKATVDGEGGEFANMTAREAKDLLSSRLVAFVSDEAHYSFKKSCNVLGIPAQNLVIVPTTQDGGIDTQALLEKMRHVRDMENKHPFFVGATAGSTVRGSFDPLDKMADVIEQYESESNSIAGAGAGKDMASSVWLHVDAAWGGSSIFSRRPDIKQLLNGVSRCDSFTMNPHKMMGAPLQTTCFVCRHPNILHQANSSNAKYLFDDRKHGAELDCGDAALTCGRRADVIKFWSMWKFYGVDGLAKRMEHKVDTLTLLAEQIQSNDGFMLACRPWAFNVNFYYLTPRMQNELSSRGIDTTTASAPSIPKDLAQELSDVTVALKLKLHSSGDMLIPYQPLNDQEADCFRIIISGKKSFDANDIDHVLTVMEKHGRDL